MIALYTPVRQDHETLALVLKSHRALEGVARRVYVDDNVCAESSKLLAEEAALDGVEVLPAPEVKFAGSENHRWNRESVRRMEAIRNQGLKLFRGNPDFTHLFMVDSDVVCNPQTVVELESVGVPIVSEVFWTRWPGSGTWMPQVWDHHPYGFESPDRVIRLKWPGFYDVHGLGACTLIRWDVESLGVRFDEISSLNRLVWGEDRWFCLRAQACGFDLKADTHRPPFHVYERSQLDEARAWYEDGAHPGYFRRHWLNAEWETKIRDSFK